MILWMICWIKWLNLKDFLLYPQRIVDILILKIYILKKNRLSSQNSV